MATDDISRYSYKCPCGASTVTFTVASPDHPWARPSQTRYSASIDCVTCKDHFCVYQISSNDEPAIVETAEMKEKRKLSEQIKDLEKMIYSSVQANRLRERVIEAIDAEESMAGRHRKLHKLNLTVESYSTYRKNPYGGEEALRFTSGATLARIGATTALGGKDQCFFSGALEKMNELENLQKKIRLKVAALERRE